MKLNIGDVFVPGQVWQTSRGGLWKVLEYDYSKGMKRVLMRAGESGGGRKQYRLWDDVGNWVIWIHADGTPTPACEQSRESCA